MDIHGLSCEDILYASAVEERMQEIRAKLRRLNDGSQDDKAMDEVRGLCLELAELRDFSWRIRPAHSVVRESYWAEYAASSAYGLYGEVTETGYWKARKYARHLKDGYREVTLDGVTFLCNGE